MNWSPCLVAGRRSADTVRRDTTGVDLHLGRRRIVGYRTFVAVIAAAYVTLIALTPRTAMMMMEESWARLLPLCRTVSRARISGIRLRPPAGSLPISLAYLLIEFTIGMRINTLAWDGSLPLILLPLAAQAVGPAARACWPPGCASW
jgi:hypothetical protein